MLQLQSFLAETIAFERNSPGWQLQQWQQRLGEWLEGVFAPMRRINPGWAPPDWLVQLLFWVISILIILWLGWQLYQVLSPYFYPTLPVEQTTELLNQPATRSISVNQWLQRSRDYARQSNYGEACRCLYQATLQQLDERKIIPQQQSRTDGEYRDLLQTLPNGNPYQILLNTHERQCFSNTEISAADFAQCQQAYREIWG